jgi:hypothetical protein
MKRRIAGIQSFRGARGDVLVSIGFLGLRVSHDGEFAEQCSGREFIHGMADVGWDDRRPISAEVDIRNNALEITHFVRSATWATL